MSVPVALPCLPMRLTSVLSTAFLPVWDPLQVSVQETQATCQRWMLAAFRAGSRGSVVDTVRSPGK